jgi:ATP-dependent exoDNAse (exonuclease V) beta subunit
LRRGGKLVVVDYKTDRVTAKDAASRRKHYAPQGEAYCEAVSRAYGEKDVSFEIVFLRHPEL